MRDDELRSWLRERNPWWKAASPAADRLAWTKADVTLRNAENLGIDYRPTILSDVAPGGLYVVRGPRRVGKSVALKRFAAELLRNPAIHPGQIIYMTLDEFDDRALRRALRLGRELTLAAGDSRRFWLIDEVTAVPDWPAIIKSARDDTALANDTVILTGSSAHGLTEARRALGAGRVGPALDPFRLLLPMTFRDFIRSTDRDLPAFPAVGPWLEQSAELRRTINELIPFLDEIDLAWQAYCEVGGFPRAVAEYRRDGVVSAAFVTDLVGWLSPDVTPEDAPESVLRLLSVLGRRMSAPLNIRGTAEAIGLSRERFHTRLSRLLNTFGAFVCPQIDDDGSPVAGAQSKFYLLDSLLAQLPTLVEVGLPVPDMTTLSEAALAMSMARAVDAVHSGRLLEGRAIGYLRTGSGNEIDFAPMPINVGGVKAATPPLESKWVADGWRPGARTMEARYGNGFVATKNILDLDLPTWAVPAGVMALLLN